MPENKSPIRLNLIATLLGPIQRIIRTILPDFAEAQLKSPATRRSVVLLADAALTRQFPVASLLPTDVRRHLIRKQLDLIIDEILLNDALPPNALERPARTKKSSSASSPRPSRGRASGSDE